MEHTISGRFAIVFFYVCLLVWLQVAVTLYLMYTEVGLAFLSGLAFSIILIPINKMIASKIGSMSSKMMEHKDERLKIMSEVLLGIKSIKLYVWEQHFMKTISSKFYM